MLTATSNSVDGITSTVASHIRDRQVLRYAGYTYDARSATYYLSQRHYDPATMRFLTKDPARDDGEESAYQYCAGDPVGKVDPTGLWWTYSALTWSKASAEKYCRRLAQRSIWQGTVSTIAGAINRAAGFVTGYAIVTPFWDNMTGWKWPKEVRKGDIWYVQLGDYWHKTAGGPKKTPPGKLYYTTEQQVAAYRSGKRYALIPLPRRGTYLASTQGKIWGRPKRANYTLKRTI